MCILIHKGLPQLLTESQRAIANDPTLGNASLLRFLYEIDSSPPAGLLLNTDGRENVASGGSVSPQDTSASTTPAADLISGHQDTAMPDSLSADALFFDYTPQITLASFIQELQTHRADIVQDAGLMPGRVTDTEFKFLNEFLLQVLFRG